MMRSKRTTKRTIKTSRLAAFTLVEIMIVVAIIGLLAAIAISNFMYVRSTAQANACINNMHQIDGAVTEWALEKGKKTGDPAPNLITDLRSEEHTSELQSLRH